MLHTAHPQPQPDQSLGEAVVVLLAEPQVDVDDLVVVWFLILPPKNTDRPEEEREEKEKEKGKERGREEREERREKRKRREKKERKREKRRERERKREEKRKRRGKERKEHKYGEYRVSRVVQIRTRHERASVSFAPTSDRLIEKGSCLEMK